MNAKSPIKSKLRMTSENPNILFTRPTINFIFMLHVIIQMFHYLFSINDGINITRIAISDFLTIQNTSSGECYAAIYITSVYILTLTYKKDTFDLTFIPFEIDITEKTFLKDIE